MILSWPLLLSITGYIIVSRFYISGGTGNSVARFNFHTLSRHLIRKCELSLIDHYQEIFHNPIMLKNTFIHIAGVGAVTEQCLWESGIADWDSSLKMTPGAISAGRKNIIANGIEESKRHFESGNPAFFSNILPSNQSWRLFSEFRESTVYLDIETTGLERDYNGITTIALYDGKNIQTYVQGQNLDDFVDGIQKYNVQVTVNLENLMVTAYNLKLKETPFYNSHRLSSPIIPENPYIADLETVDRIKYGSGFVHSNYW